MQNMILSALLINHPLPTGFGSAGKVGEHWTKPLNQLTVDQLADYIRPLRESSALLRIPVTLLHDGVPDELIERCQTDQFRFERTTISEPNTNAYDARFLAYRRWLSFSDFDGVLTITDSNDSVIGENPAEWFEANHSGDVVVCGIDGGTVAGNPWWTENIEWMPPEYQKLFRGKLSTKQALLCGTLIGRRRRLLAMIDTMTEEIERLLTWFWTDPLKQPPRGADIHAFNFLAHHADLGELSPVRLTYGSCPVWHDRGAMRLLPRDRPPGIRFREHTQDVGVWVQVYDENEYKIPEDLTGQIVLDIGLHIGSFSSLCKSRGASEVWGVEANIDNLRLAINNVHATPGDGVFQPFYGAAWRSDRRGDRVKFIHPHAEHTGCGVTRADGEYDVPSIELDVLIKAITDHGRRRINWLKIDCEGAEWPILFTSRGLDLVDHIVGEYHAGPIETFDARSTVPGVEYSIEALRKLLANQGFEVEILPPNDLQFNLFFAHRKPYPVSKRD